MKRILFWVLLATTGCTVRYESEASSADGASVDAAARWDAGIDDAQRPDVGLDASGFDADVVRDAGFDAQRPDVGPDASGFDAGVVRDAGFDARVGDAAADAAIAPTDAGPRPRRDAADTAPPGCGLPLVAECTGGAPSIYDGVCAARELHVVGHYQPSTGEVTVTVARTGVPVVLALVSYEPTTWNVEIPLGVEVERIVVDGLNPQVLVAPPGIPVLDRSGAGGVACAFRWPFDSGGCDTEGLVASLEALTGLRPTSFMGCYEGVGYRVGG